MAEDGTDRFAAYRFHVETEGDAPRRGSRAGSTNDVPRRGSRSEGGGEDEGLQPEEQHSPRGGVSSSGEAAPVGSLSAGEAAAFGVHSFGDPSNARLGSLEGGTHGGLKYGSAQKVAGIPDGAIRQVACGELLTLTLLVNGQVWMWGNGNATPVLQRGFSRRVIQVAVGQDHMCAVTEGDSRNMLTWGRNEHGQCGHGSASLSVARPTVVRGLPRDCRVVHVSCGASFTIALSQRGNAFGWGRNDMKQLGLMQASWKDKDIVPSPVRIDELSKKLESVDGPGAAEVKDTLKYSRLMMACGSEHAVSWVSSFGAFMQAEQQENVRRLLLRVSELELELREVRLISSIGRSAEAAAGAATAGSGGGGGGGGGGGTPTTMVITNGVAANGGRRANGASGGSTALSMLRLPPAEAESALVAASVEAGGGSPVVSSAATQQLLPWQQHQENQQQRQLHLQAGGAVPRRLLNDPAVAEADFLLREVGNEVFRGEAAVQQLEESLRTKIKDMNDVKNAVAISSKSVAELWQGVEQSRAQLAEEGGPGTARNAMAMRAVEAMLRKQRDLTQMAQAGETAVQQTVATLTALQNEAAQLAEQIEARTRQLGMQRMVLNALAARRDERVAELRGQWVRTEAGAIHDLFEIMRSAMSDLRETTVERLAAANAQLDASRQPSPPQQALPQRRKGIEELVSISNARIDQVLSRTKMELGVGLDKELDAAAGGNDAALEVVSGLIAAVQDSADVRKELNFYISAIMGVKRQAAEQAAAGGGLA
jgi:hypothetical protein